MKLAAALAATLLLLAPAALAQNGSMSMGLYNDESSFRPDLSSRDLKVIVRVLRLRPDAEKALMDLYAGYDGTLQSEGAAVREYVESQIERAEVMQDTHLLDPAQKRLAEWSKRSEEIKKGFLSDLKSLLTTDQESRWPIVERELRRMKYIGLGRLCGESIDLVRLTGEVLGDDPSQELSDLLNRYADELDRALIARKTLIDDKQKEYQDKLKSDPKGAESIWRDVQRARAAVRDVNDRYVRLIAVMLPADKAAALNRDYFDQSYRPLTKPTRTQGYVKDAGALKTLTPAQKTSLEQIKARYETDRRGLLEKEARAWRDFEMDWKPDDLARALGERNDEHGQQQYNGAWLPDNNPLIESRRERLDLDLRVRKEIDNLLTDQQRADIPSRLTPYATFDNWTPWGL